MKGDGINCNCGGETCVRYKRDRPECIVRGRRCMVCGTKFQTKELRVGSTNVTGCRKPHGNIADAMERVGEPRDD